MFVQCAAELNSYPSDLARYLFLCSAGAVASTVLSNSSRSFTPWIRNTCLSGGYAYLAGDAAAGVDPAAGITGAGAHVAGGAGAVGAVLPAASEFDFAWEGDRQSGEAAV